MIVKLLTEHHLEFLSLEGGCTDSSESTHVKMPHCWKSHALAHLALQQIQSHSYLIFISHNKRESYKPENCIKVYGNLISWNYFWSLTVFLKKDGIYYKHWEDLDIKCLVCLSVEKNNSGSGLFYRIPNSILMHLIL